MSLSQQIKEYALTIGFDACGICKAENIDSRSQEEFDHWLSQGYQADMNYMARNCDKRCNPTQLMQGARSIICVALNYYPHQTLPAHHPQFAYYAYGKDYHNVVKDKLNTLFQYIKTLKPDIQGRAFCDTAPLLERYWAVKAGIGFVGKNSLLIIPRKGSYFFLGELLLNLDLEYDTPISLSCGKCTRCIDACPTKAIIKPREVNACKCISYQTIENKGQIAKDVADKLCDNVYGCDICQQVCPWNRFAQPHQTPEFTPKHQLNELSMERLEKLTIEEYREIFKGSAVKRAKYEGLKRNITTLKKYKHNDIIK